MAGIILVFLVLGLSSPILSKSMICQPHSVNRPLVAAHRGASAYRPEHTIEAYTLAIEMGADIIEPDLVITKDRVLVVRHENEISGTTNVASLAQFKDRKTTKMIDGVEMTGWFTEDFTLAELKTIRAVERIPQFRPNNTKYDGKFPIATFDEVIALAKKKSIETERTIAIYPETKHPSYFQSIGLPLEDLLLERLAKEGWNTKESPVFIQSFEVSNLKEMRKKTNATLVQLVGIPGEQPYDFVLKGPSEKRMNEDLVTAKGLQEIATYADVVAPYKDYIITLDSSKNLGKPTELIHNAHSVGLKVHTWTFRPENQFLPTNLKSNNNTSDRGDSITEIKAFLKAGLDGFFTDAADIGRKAVDEIHTSFHLQE